MGARRLRSVFASLLCVLLCVLLDGTSLASGATVRFGGAGEGSGRIKGAMGVAIDNAASGALYVTDYLNYRVDEFDASGAFQMAWGWGVNEASPRQELQVCTVACQAGEEGSGAGQPGGSGYRGIAVDNNPLSASYGDMYVVDWENFRVQKFSPSGQFLLTFGGEVNEASKGDVCVAGEKCTRGKEGTGNGQFAWAYNQNDTIAVGPGGAVYVGDQARVEVFEQSGAWKENISLAGISATGKVTALAANGSGDVFVKDEGASGVRELEPNGAEKATQFDSRSSSIEAIALDGSGDLYVADTTGGFHVLKYSPAGTELEAFGYATATSADGMAFSDPLGELYISPKRPEIWVLTPPSAGPLVESSSESATVGERGAVALHAKVNPEGSATTYSFEYTTQAAFEAEGYSKAISTPGASAGSGFADQQVSASLSKLAPGVYHYRIIATSTQGSVTGSDQTFTNALVQGPWVTNIANTSATLAVNIDPAGLSTRYELQYGPSISYGTTLAGNAGAGTGYVQVTYHQQELVADTTYHYRVLLTNELGTYEGPDQTFTTQSSGEELTLPDGRAWELVSPADKQGALIELFESGNLIQAAVGGSAITYPAARPVGEGVVGSTGLSQILSRRGPAGWESTDITPPQAAPEEGVPGVELFAEPFYMLSSPDLSISVFEPANVFTHLTVEPTERTILLRNNVENSFTPVVSSANVPPGTEYGGISFGNSGTQMRFVDASPDLKHVVLTSPAALTPEAEPPECEARHCKSYHYHLFEWNNGDLQLVNILPNGEPYKEKAELAPGEGADAHAISSDGRWIVWRTISGFSGRARLYVRDMVNRQTYQVGGADLPEFQTMSSDGSRLFFLEGGDLYQYDTGTHSGVDLTSDHLRSEANAGVKRAVIGASSDGSYVYFVATGVLATGGVSGGDNLYVLHYEGGAWTTTYVATLSPEDEKSWSSGGEGALQPSAISSEVSTNGRYLAFMSERSLTGYDNVDALSGQPDEEVYLYDALTGRLVCASCDPSGARPTGVLDSYATGRNENTPLVDRKHTWSFKLTRWLAGSVPGWDQTGQLSLYQPRYLDDRGRLFFDSPDALVGQDTNGLEDVYEYEPVGVGDCREMGSGFNIRSLGCVSLLSSGSSSSESAFFDASESGDDVFFVTTSRLTSADYDTSYDIYDAHVCSAAVPCVAAPVSPPPCSSGDSCKAAPTPQPEIFGAAPSATFNGEGDVSTSATPVVKPKSVGRAQRLAGALKACRKKRAKRTRVSCERKARRRFGTARTGKAKATRKGGR